MSFLSHISVFQQARLKLTLWYLFIIMIISAAFSFGIYNLMTIELNRIEQLQIRDVGYRLRELNMLNLPPEVREELRQRILDHSIIEEAKKRLQLIMLLINLGILTASALAAYFLAGKTLRPIQEMVDEQTRFITDSSHELRTPLTALRSEMEVTLRDKKLTIKDAKEIIKSNLEEVIAIQSLTENLLKLTKSFKNKPKIIENIEISEIVQDSIKKILPIAKQKNIKIIAKVDKTIMQTNRNELTDLLVIFLDNAIKYSGKTTTIEVLSRKKGSNVELKVRDEGIGIDQKDIPHLFDRFYRADKSRSKNDAEGFGLGLSIAKRIVDNYKGQIEVESKPNKGSIFTITLPLK